MRIICCDGGRTDGNDQTATVGELLLIGRRQRLGAGGDDDRVERRLFRQAERAVVQVDVDVGVAESSESLAGVAKQFLNSFDGMHFASQQRQHSRAVAGAGADFQHFVVGRDAEPPGT